ANAAFVEIRPGGSHVTSERAQRTRRDAQVERLDVESRRLAVHVHGEPGGAFDAEAPAALHLHRSDADVRALERARQDREEFEEADARREADIEQAVVVARFGCETKGAANATAVADRRQEQLAFPAPIAPIEAHRIRAEVRQRANEGGQVDRRTAQALD